MKLREIIDYTFSYWPAKALALLAAIILFVFNRMNTLDTNIFRVPLKVLMPAGYAIASPYPTEINITVKSSKQSNMEKLDNSNIVKYVRLFANFSDINSTGNFKRRVEYNVNELTKEQVLFIEHIDPPQITLTLENEVVKRVNVEANITGEPADGYALVNSTLNPPTVILRGPESMVEPIRNVKTEVISLIGRAQSMQTTVQLMPLSPLITVEGRNIIEFNGEIKERSASKVISEVPITLVNLSPHLMLENQLNTGYMKVKGAEMLLNNLDNYQVKLLVDLSSIIWPGKYTLPVKPQVPKDTSVTEYSPDKIIISLVRKN